MPYNCMKYMKRAFLVWINTYNILRDLKLFSSMTQILRNPVLDIKAVRTATQNPHEYPQVQSKILNTNIKIHFPVTFSNVSDLFIMNKPKFLEREGCCIDYFESW
jgi:hypothetical protein